MSDQVIDFNSLCEHGYTKALPSYCSRCTIEQNNKIFFAKDKQLRVLKRRIKKLEWALHTIADMPVIDWCDEACTKWQPSKIAYEALWNRRK